MSFVLHVAYCINVPSDMDLTYLPVLVSSRGADNLETSQHNDIYSEYSAGHMTRAEMSLPLFTAY